MDWRFWFGKRYLLVDDFIRLCKVVGLYQVTKEELEDYEREGWVLPAARMVAPDEYAVASARERYGSEAFEVDEKYSAYYNLDMRIRHSRPPSLEPEEDLRHPIDQSWGTVEGLYNPGEQEFTPWGNYRVRIYEGDFEIYEPTAFHFYHYWQVHQLYHVRRSRSGYYKGDPPMWKTKGKSLEWARVFDPTAYFRSLYQAWYEKLTGSLSPDDTGLLIFTPAKQDELRRAARRSAQDTLETCGLDQDSLFGNLDWLIRLHLDYEEADRVRLAEAVKEDVWTTVELLHFAYQIQTEEIVQRAGRLGGYRENYLEVMFPNHRKQTRAAALRILHSFAEQHNKRASAYGILNEDIEGLVDFVEATDLAWIEYVLQKLNEDYFAAHSWQTAANWLHLKAVASFPESLAKILILDKADAETQSKYESQKSPAFATAVDLLLGHVATPVLHEWKAENSRWSAHSKSDFAIKLAHLMHRIEAAPTEDAFLGASLSLTIMLRNFTSHLLLEDEELLQHGQYVRCLRAVMTTVFMIWKVTKLRQWV